MTANYTLGITLVVHFEHADHKEHWEGKRLLFHIFSESFSTFSRVYFAFFFFLSLPRKLLHATGCLNQRADTHSTTSVSSAISSCLLSLSIFACSLFALSAGWGALHMWIRCQSYSFSDSRPQPAPHTNLIFFPISSLLLCQHFLIVPSAGSFGSAVTCVLCPCVSALVYWLFSRDAQVVVPARQYWPLCGSKPLLQVYEW